MSFFYLQAISLVLKRWKENPKLTKRQIGVWSHWMTDDPENDKPLASEDVGRYKRILKEKTPKRK